MITKPAWLQAAMAELHWGQGGPWPPLANENLHCMNSKMATVHYCSKRMAPLILLKLEVKLRQWQAGCHNKLYFARHLA